MRKCLMAFLAIGITSAAWAQGTISFKTSITHNPIYYTTDTQQTPSALALVSTDGKVFGQTVNYEIYSAPDGTVLKMGANGPNFTGWTGTAVGPVSYTIPGVVSPGTTITLPTSSGSPGVPAEVEVFAYTGTLANPILMGWSGESFAGGNTVTYNGQTTSVGAFGWSQGTGIPNGVPPTPPTIPVTGSAGLGSIVLTDPSLLAPVPEPGTLAIGGLGMAALWLFRRRK